MLGRLKNNSILNKEQQNFFHLRRKKMAREIVKEYVEKKEWYEIKMKGEKNCARHRDLTKELGFSSKAVRVYQRAYRLQRICFFYLT